MRWDAPQTRLELATFGLGGQRATIALLGRKILVYITSRPMPLAPEYIPFGKMTYIRIRGSLMLLSADL